MIDHSRFLNAIRYRQIQSEVCGVQFCNKSFSNPSYADWLDEMTKKLQDWRTQAASMIEIMPSWIDLSAWYNVFMLHRPCMPNPNSDANSVITCFTATENLVARYWESTSVAPSKFPWHTVHNCVETGAVLLYNMKNHPTLFTSESAIGIAPALNVLNKISNIFCILAERWPAAWQCGDFYDNAKKEVLKNLFNVSNGSRQNGQSSILDVLDDIVLRRPGDTQYAPLFGGSSSEPEADFAFPDSLESWRNLSYPQISPPMGTSIFDFSMMDMEFDDLDWTHLLASEIGPVPSSEITAVKFDLPIAEMKAVAQTSPVSETIATDAYIASALAQLPPCQHCRKRRTKCDRLLPSCRRCVKSGIECKFYDPVLSRDTPRQYVCALKEKFDSLSSILKKSPERPEDHNNGLGSITRQAVRALSPAIEVRGPIQLQPYIGNMSMFNQMSALTTKVTLLGKPVTFPPKPKLQGILRMVPMSYRPASNGPASLPAHDIAQSLATQYFYSFELLCPIFGLENINKAIDSVYNKRSPNALAATQSNVTVSLILALMTRLLSRKDVGLAEWSKALFERAMTDYHHLISTLGYPSISSLKINILLCWYLWLSPSSGNVWRMTGQADRSAMDLRRVLNYGDGGSWEDWVNYTTLFRIEW